MSRIAKYLSDSVLCECGHPAYLHIFRVAACRQEDGRGQYCGCAKFAVPVARKTPTGFEVTSFNSFDNQARKPKSAWNANAA